MGRILAECVKENEHSGKEGAGYTQRWLGERLGYSNPKTAETAPNKIMKGEQSLTLKQLEACIDIFQQPADHFIPTADDGGPKEDKIKALRNKYEEKDGQHRPPAHL